VPNGAEQAEQERDAELRLQELEVRLDVKFKRREWLLEAMTHTSWINERGAEGRDNERLEYLGDAVLELVAAEYLFNRFPNYDEGQLTQMRSSLVSTVALAGIGEQLRLGEALRLGRGATKSGARRLVSLHANAFEAIIGATFLDQGYRKAGKIFLSRIGDLSSWTDPNFKGRLQALAQERFGKPPLYKTLADGNSRPRQYVSQVSVEAGPVLGEGRGGTKQAAEQGAARAAIDSMVAPVSKKRRRGPRSSPVATGAVALGTLPTVAADIPLPTPADSIELDPTAIGTTPATPARKRRRRSRGGVASAAVAAAEGEAVSPQSPLQPVAAGPASETLAGAGPEAQPARRRRRRSRGGNGGNSPEGALNPSNPAGEVVANPTAGVDGPAIVATTVPDPAPARRRWRRPRGGSTPASVDASAVAGPGPLPEASSTSVASEATPESSASGEGNSEAAQRKRTHRGHRGGRRRSGRPATPTP
jgi:ribonuclease-3